MKLLKNGQINNILKHGLISAWSFLNKGCMYVCSSSFQSFRSFNLRSQAWTIESVPYLVAISHTLYGHIYETLDGQLSVQWSVRILTHLPANSKFN